MRWGGCGKRAGTWFPGSLRHLEADACQQPQVIGQAGRLSRLLSNLSSKVWREITELVHMASQKRTWGVSPGQERGRLRTDILLSLTEGTGSLGFPVNHSRSAWVC